MLELQKIAGWMNSTSERGSVITQEVSSAASLKVSYSKHKDVRDEKTLEGYNWFSDDDDSNVKKNIPEPSKNYLLKFLFTGR